MVRGVKQTFAATAPIAIFADPDILVKAPLVAAGFGDRQIYIALDWKFSSTTAGEPYDEQVAAITEKALEACIQHVEAIGQRTEEGIRILMTALIESGIAIFAVRSVPPCLRGGTSSVALLGDGVLAPRPAAWCQSGGGLREISSLYHDAADKGMYPHAEPTHWETYREQVREWRVRSLRRRRSPSCAASRRSVNPAGAWH